MKCNIKIKWNKIIGKQDWMRNKLKRYFEKLKATK
jgi:hypothetical protein